MSDDVGFGVTRDAQWRAVGNVTVPAGSAVATGDPCYGGLDPVDGTLAAGTWRWDVRDADDTGASVFRVHEVRLVAVDAPGTVDAWTWLDDYGTSTDDPLPTDTVGVLGYTGYRGVDAGTVAWLITRPDDDGPSVDFDDVLYHYSDAVPHMGGRLLSTSSGWGDGGYPCAARTIDGVVVEVRIVFIPPDPAPADVDTFTQLLPGAFTGLTVDTSDPHADGPALVPVHAAGPVGIIVNRTWYSYDGRSGAGERTYDSVVGVALPALGLAVSHGLGSGYPRLSDLDLPETLAPLTVALGNTYNTITRLSGLWDRVTGDTRAALVVSEDTGTPRTSGPNGGITAKTDTTVVVWLTATLPAPVYAV